jgi:hypothetical protein
MIWTIVSILFIVWLVGFLTKFTLGGFIHLLLVAGLILAIYNLLMT